MVDLVEIFNLAPQKDIYTFLKDTTLVEREVLCKQPGFDKMCKLIDRDTFTKMTGTGFLNYGNSSLYEILVRFGDFDAVMDFIKAARPTFIYTDEFRNLVKHYTKQKKIYICSWKIQV